MEETKLRKRAAEELKSEKARVKMIAERKIREEEKKDAKPAVKVKLPKLEITKFKGNHLHWTCFWCQFKAEIYRSSLSPVAKFFHQAKSILIKKYRKPKEVANAHIQSVMSRSTINNINPYKIHKF